MLQFPKSFLQNIFVVSRVQPWSSTIYYYPASSYYLARNWPKAHRMITREPNQIFQIFHRKWRVLAWRKEWPPGAANPCWIGFRVL